MVPRRIVIGDVHGHYQSLETLLASLELRTQDRVYFLGDLIDRGPQSAEVVDLVMRQGYGCVLGNHEAMMLDVIRYGAAAAELLEAWLYSGGQNTLRSYQNAIPQRHLTWLQERPLYLDLGDYWLVHAGVDPSLPLEQQNVEICCWIRDEFHSSTQPYFPHKTIVTGHTITFTLPDIPPGKVAQGIGWIDIDTGVYHRRSGWLTALDLDRQWIYQVQTHSQLLRDFPLQEAIATVDPQQVLRRSVIAE